MNSRLSIFTRPAISCCRPAMKLVVEWRRDDKMFLPSERFVSEKQVGTLHKHFFPRFFCAFCRSSCRAEVSHCRQLRSSEGPTSSADHLQIAAMRFGSPGASGVKPRDFALKASEESKWFIRLVQLHDKAIRCILSMLRSLSLCFSQINRHNRQAPRLCEWGPRKHILLQRLGIV